MIYFQPETMLKDLGNDGSSTVSHAFTLLGFMLFAFRFLRYHVHGFDGRIEMTSLG
jgi:hypothetical protein